MQGDLGLELYVDDNICKLIKTKAYLTIFSKTFLWKNTRIPSFSLLFARDYLDRGLGLKSVG